MKQKSPNIILIVMDTVRADHLSYYGYHRDTTPNIDKIAEQGTLYDNAFSTAPWTPPSHASVFTGKYPSHHKTMGRNVCLKTENTTVAEVLSENGYRTLGVTCCQILGLGSGFEKGFSRFIEIRESSLTGLIKRKGSLAKDFLRKMIYGPDKGTYQATEEIKNFIKSNNKAKSSPFFVFVNYFTCHTPYDPPSPFKKRYCNEFNESRFYFQELLLNKTLKRTSEKISNSDIDFQRLKWIASGGGGFSFAVKEISVSEAEWKAVESWYDGELAYLDRQIGHLVDFLQEAGIFDNTLLIITSDHGENFGDHGLAVHPLCLYDSLLRVPLIISYPVSMPRKKKISSVVSLVDIYPTILEAAKAKEHKANVDGKSLFPFGEQKIHDFVCAEYGALHTHGFGGLQAWSLSSSTRNKLLKIDKGCKSIRNSRYKYILWDDKEELYDIRNDPKEQVDISSQHPEVIQELKKQLESTIDISYVGPKDFPKGQERQILNRLRALGYV